MARGKEQAIFAIDQCLVELQQGCRLDERAQLPEPARAHEQRGQSEHHAIEGGEIWSAMAGAIADEQLMLQHQGLCGDGTDALWAE